MTHRRDDEAWMYLRSRTPTAIHLARRLVMTSLATPGTVLLIGLADQWSPAAGAAALGHEPFDQDHVSGACVNRVRIRLAGSRIGCN